MPEERLKLRIGERAAGVPRGLLDAPKGIRGNDPLLCRPVEGPHDDLDDVSFCPIALPVSVNGNPLLDVDRQAITVIHLAKAVGLGKKLEVVEARLERFLAVFRFVEC
jgi:hypothetical protein